MRRVGLFLAAAAALATLSLTGGKPTPVEAYGLRNCHSAVQATVLQRGVASCQDRDGFGSGTEIRVWIICSNEIGSTGWLIGGWQTNPNAYSIRACPSSSYTVSTVTYQLI